MTASEETRAFIASLPGSRSFNVCAGCAALGRCQMGLVGGVDADGKVAGQVTFGAQHAGAPGVVHGGHLAVVLDEALSHALVSRGTLTVTAALEVTYRRPAIVGETMDVTAEVEGFTDDRWTVTGRITSRQTGEDVATARARFAARDASHWQRAAEAHDRLMGPVDPA